MYSSSYTRQLYRQYILQDERNVPEYESVVVEYRFEEGVAPAGSMNNILFDSKSPPNFGTDLVTNGGFEGPYVGGVAASWTIDASVVATEESDGFGGSAQRLSNCNGIAKGMHQTGISVTSGSIYIIDFGVQRNSGTGNFQVEIANMNGMGIYSVQNSDMNTAFRDRYYFYGVANSNTFDITITADDVNLDFTIGDFHIREITGGNHMVMDFNIYDRTRRGVNFYDMNGVDQYFYIEDSRQIDLDPVNKPFTLACIFQPENNQTRPFAKWNNSNNRSYDFRIGVPRDLRLIISDTGTAFTDLADTTTNYTIPYPTYMYWSCSFDAGNFEMMKDGVILNINHSSGPPTTTTTIFNGSSRVQVGAVTTGSTPGGFMQGKIGKIIFWNGTALSAAQKLQVFNLLRTGYGI